MTTYILVDGVPVAESDVAKRIAFMESDGWHVGFDLVDFGSNDVFRVSTVFLQHDHRYDGDGPPILFETMVFHGHSSLDDLYVDRYCTLADAKTGHARIVARLRAAVAAKPEATAEELIEAIEETRL